MTDTELRVAGIEALLNALGDIETERFIALLLREPFDYTIWRFLIGKRCQEMNYDKRIP